MRSKVSKLSALSRMAGVHLLATLAVLTATAPPGTAQELPVEEPPLELPGESEDDAAASVGGLRRIVWRDYADGWEREEYDERGQRVSFEAKRGDHAHHDGDGASGGEDQDGDLVTIRDPEEVLTDLSDDADELIDVLSSGSLTALQDFTLNYAPPHVTETMVDIKCSAERAYRQDLPWVRLGWAGTPSFRITTAVPAAWRAAIVAGKDQWQNTVNACGSPDLIGFKASYLGTTTTRVSGNTTCPTMPPANIVDIRPLGPSNFIAFACTWVDATGRIVRGLIVFNSSVPFSTSSAPEQGRYDVHGTAAHEWGHFLGLHHTGSCSDMNRQVMNSCILKGDASWRYLGAGDIEGAHNLYPVGTLYANTGTQATLTNPVSGQKLAQGRYYDVRFRVRNAGGLPWALNGRVRVNVDGALKNLEVPGEWESSTIVGRLQRNVTTPAKAFVSPGETGELKFRIAAPFDTNERFYGGGIGAIVVDRPWVGDVRNVLSADVGSFGASITDGSTDVVVSRTTGLFTGDAFIEVRNDGTAPLYLRDLVRLGTSNPRNRASALAGDDWISSSRPTALNSGPLGRSWVGPGEKGRFEFKFDAENASPFLLTSAETFEVVADAPWGEQRWKGPQHVINVTVTP